MASEVASERDFSGAGDIDTANRANLGPELFADLMFISRNLHVLPQESAPGRVDVFLQKLGELAKNDVTLNLLLEDIEGAASDSE